ncbi:hypothetical protein V8E36_006274 [Tilletia maclaganii]
MSSPSLSFPPMPEEVLFDIFGQLAWDDLDPGSVTRSESTSRLDELDIGNNKRKTWSAFIQDWSENFHDAVKQGKPIPTFSALSGGRSWLRTPHATTGLRFWKAVFGAAIPK